MTVTVVVPSAEQPLPVTYLHMIPYRGKLLKEKNFTNFMI